jgi:alpha-amylase
VYYGQESFLTGGNDPDNREALWDHGYTGNDLIRALNKLRQIAISNDPKFAVTLSQYLYHDDFQIFYQKGQLLVGLSGQSKIRNVSAYDITIQGTTYKPGEVLLEALSCQSLTVGAGPVVVNMKDGAPVVLFPKSALTGSGICNL